MYIDQLGDGTPYSQSVQADYDMADDSHHWDINVFSAIADSLTVSVTHINVPDGMPVRLGYFDFSTLTVFNTEVNPGDTLDITTYFNQGATQTIFIDVGDTTAPAVQLTYPNGLEIFKSGSNFLPGGMYLEHDGQYMISYDGGMNFDSIEYVITYDNAGQPQISGLWPENYLSNEVLLYVSAGDLLGNRADDISDYHFTVVGDSLAFTSSTETYWQMISSPLITESSYTDQLGSDFQDEYVLWFWDGLGYTPDGPANGILGAFLGTENAEVFDFIGEPQTAPAVELDVIDAGWYLFGNPYVRTMNIDSLVFTKDEMTLTHEEAVSANWLADVVYTYGVNPPLGNEGYYQVDKLELGQGYWIGFLEDSVSIKFEPHRDAAADTIETSFSWMLAIGETQKLLIGGYSEASDSYDRFDHPAAPSSPGENATYAHILHPEWELSTGSAYSRDIRSTEWSIEQTYDIEISSCCESSTITWEFENIPDDIDIALVSSTGEVVNMRQTSSLGVGSNFSGSILLGMGVLSNGGSYALPTLFALHQNYPNPFNPMTQIRYDLPFTDHVNITIYDVMGRKIKSLLDMEQKAGYRSIEWNATNDLGQPVSAGMYIYTIQTGEFRQTRKMVLLK